MIEISWSIIIIVITMFFAIANGIMDSRRILELLIENEQLKKYS